MSLLLSARRHVISRRVLDKSDPTTSSKTPASPGFTARSLLTVNQIYCRGYHRLYVQAPSQLPETGPAILVCNHISGLDPFLLQSAVNRPVVWMMASEYYEIGMLRGVFRAVNAIPVHRSGRDMAATRAALRALDRGEVLGIFPEGRIEEGTRDLLPFQTGVAMMALRAQVPVYPTYIDGTNRGQGMLRAFLTPNEVRIRFGQPVKLENGPGKPDLDRETGRIQSAVANLKSSMGYGRLW
jgi:1-acyl-sn-glycerol-3-phosphate acyltransferase